jgi:peptidylprolyl isomerase
MLLFSALAAADTAKPTYADLLKTSSASDWRPLVDDNTMYLELDGTQARGRVIIELMPAMAPNHVANIKALVREKYFDGLSILRAQDNYVVQWGDPTEKKVPQKAKKTLPAEFTVPIAPDMPFTRLPDGDGYAPQTGFSNGFPSARDPKSGRAWMTHCYSMVGVGRDVAEDSGGGTELYAVIGHAPRHLDRNVTLVGRVVQGMPLLSTLPRGVAAMGFYDKDEQRVPIKSVRMAADVPAAERTPLEVIRTDTPLFAKLLESLRNRGGDWFKAQAGYIEVCNVPLAVRARSN